MDFLPHAKLVHSQRGHDGLSQSLVLAAEGCKGFNCFCIPIICCCKLAVALAAVATSVVCAPEIAATPGHSLQQTS